jgi:hypothetical protein
MKAKVEQVGHLRSGLGWSRGMRHWLKKAKAKAERYSARRNPETTPGYGRYYGWAD